MKKWKVLDSEYVIQNWPYHRTRRDRCRLPTGMEIESYVHEYPNWVNAVVLTPELELVMVTQYRHGSGEFSIETPGGMVDPGEDPMQAAVREVLEETGYHSEEPPIFLGEFSPNPATSNNRVTTFLLRNARQVEAQHLDSTEEIEIRLIPFAEFGRMIKAGQAPQIFSAIGYYLAKELLAL